MKTTLVASWLLFALLLCSQSNAGDFIMRNGYGFYETMKVFIVKGEDPANRMMKWDVHLDDGEIDRIREACK